MKEYYNIIGLDIDNVFKHPEDRNIYKLNFIYDVELLNKPNLETGKHEELKKTSIFAEIKFKNGSSLLLYKLNEKDNKKRLDQIVKIAKMDKYDIFYKSDYADIEQEIYIIKLRDWRFNKLYRYYSSSWVFIYKALDILTEKHKEIKIF